MMLKKVLPGCCAILLCGCAASSSMAERTDMYIQKAQSEEVRSANKARKYYSYYAEPGIGRYSTQENGNIFCYNGTRFLMNLNVAGIINGTYQTDAAARSSDQMKDAVFAEHGRYEDRDQEPHPYYLSIYQLSGKKYLTELNTDTVNFYAVSDALTASEISGEMLKIARSLVIDKDEILAAYSNQEAPAYQSEKTGIYDETAPENGAVSELIGESRKEADAQTVSGQ